MKLYVSDTRGDIKNCHYPTEVVATDVRSLERATHYDHVMAKYKSNYRLKANFIESDCIAMDLDNDESDDPKDWKDIKGIKEAFKDVTFFVVYSRHHMKKKENQTPRPRLHVYFPIPAITDVNEYEGLKEQLADYYPFFDRNALDGARLFFGVERPVVEIIRGRKHVTECLEDTFEAWDKAQGTVQEGNRNNAMSHYAGRVLIRHGNTEEARALFDKKAESCSPPLPEDELGKIWQSALKFGNKITSSEGYIPPEKYNSKMALEPEDYSDVGQAEVLTATYKDKLRYSPSTDYMVYNGSFWEESKPKAQAVAQELTTGQLEEAEVEVAKVMKEMKANGGLDLMITMGKIRAQNAFDDEQKCSFAEYEKALAYKKYAINRRDSRRITSGLKEAQPMLQIDPKDLDANEFLLNTPTATYDLRQGLNSVMESNPLHFITKQTVVDPSDEGADIWQAMLDVTFKKDKELIDYVQKVAGLAAIGKVYVEALIIAYGEGRNGKSTFWNVISRVFGSYSGNISADVLTVGTRRNVKPELAEAKGKRLLIAAELEEGMRLNTSNIKQLCSTDEIYAEKKYKDPFGYIPTHSLVLYTNHLPKVGAIDEGTWRRLIVIPFEAVIEGKSDIKNYADYLFKEAGGAILSWIIEGAEKVIKDDFKIVLPKKVQEAIKIYKENNDWLCHFLTECCEIDKSHIAKSGEVYEEYRAFCVRTGEFIRSTTDFYMALESSKFERFRDRKGRYIKGLKLKSEFV